MTPRRCPYSLRRGRRTNTLREALLFTLAHRSVDPSVVEARDGGRVLQLVSGLVMAALGLLLVFKPEARRSADDPGLG